MIVLLILGVILLALLLIPVGGETISENGRREYRLIWAGIRFRASLPALAGKREQTDKPRAIAKTLASLSESKASALELWNRFGMELPYRIGRTLKRFYRCLRVRVHRFDLLIGFPDPAMTGIVYGAACASAGMIPAHIPVRLAADFVNHETRLNYRISLLVIPGQLLFELLRAVVTLRLWKFIRFRRPIRSGIQTRRQHV